MTGRSSYGGFRTLQSRVLPSSVATTGAGDTFDAALVAALLDGLPEAEALRWACAAGAHSTGHSGGTAGQRHRRCAARRARRRNRADLPSTPSEVLMPLTTTAALVKAAASAGRAVLAFNVVTLEQLEGVLAGAERAGHPVVLQVSENAVAFHGGRVGALAAACRVAAEESTAQASLHLDHATDLDLVASAAAHGFSSVMVDASRLPHDENVAVTARATRALHDQGLFVEAELGEVGGKDGAHAPGVRTDPGQAATFVAATGVDALAVAVGSSHAMATRTARLDHDLVARLHAAVPVPLVLHGSSGVPAEGLAGPSPPG